MGLMVSLHISIAVVSPLRLEWLPVGVQWAPSDKNVSLRIRLAGEPVIGGRGYSAL
jgi:hypothetical protein